MSKEIKRRNHEKSKAAKQKRKLRRENKRLLNRKAYKKVVDIKEIEQNFSRAAWKPPKTAQTKLEKPKVGFDREAWLAFGQAAVKDDSSLENRK